MVWKLKNNASEGLHSVYALKGCDITGLGCRLILISHKYENLLKPRMDTNMHELFNIETIRENSCPFVVPLL